MCCVPVMMFPLFAVLFAGARSERASQEADAVKAADMKRVIHYM
jgi:hypothetical protein